MSDEAPNRTTVKELKNRFKAVTDEEGFFQLLDELTPEELRLADQAGFLAGKGAWPHHLKMRIDELDRAETRAQFWTQLGVATKQAEAAKWAARAAIAVAVIAALQLAFQLLVDQ